MTRGEGLLPSALVQCDPPGLPRQAKALLATTEKGEGWHGPPQEMIAQARSEA